MKKKKKTTTGNIEETRARNDITNINEMW